MHFGLFNAPATFQRLMEQVPGHLIGIGVLAYIVVLIYSETPEQQIKISSTLMKLRANAQMSD